MYDASEHAEDLDPRRQPRGVVRRRDWASATRSVPVIPRLQELLATVLVRLGVVR